MLPFVIAKLIYKPLRILPILLKKYKRNIFNSLGISLTQLLCKEMILNFI